jgi:hypothetical protein
LDNYHLAQDVKHRIAAHHNQEHIMKISSKLFATAIMAAALAACGGGNSLGEPEVLLQTHPVAEQTGPMAVMAAVTPQLATARTPNVNSFFNWAELTYPNLFEGPQSNRTIDVWIYRYYPKTDIYLGTNTSGDVLGLVGKGNGEYNSVPLGKITDFSCSVTPSECTASANAMPIANPGIAKNVSVGTLVKLDGSASSDANGDTLSYAWTLTSKPSGSAATLSQTNIAKTTFTADVAGQYVASLVVNDGSLTSAAASVTVTATASTPASSAKMNMAQTISDGAQGTTMAFSGVALMTGNLPAQSFYPPGKVADYTGFQFLRDNDPDNMGHNTSFLTRVANNVIYNLSASQLAQLSALAATQQSQIEHYGYGRYPLMQAFRRLIDGNIPVGSSGLNKNAVKAASRALYLIDGQISFDRAVLYANIINSLTDTQKAYFGAMKGKGWSSWPDITDAQINSKMTGLAQGSKVAVMTYASDIYSWYAGSLEADIYFCPERHGTYYGGFYIKDAPAVGHEGYSIDEQMTATAGAALIDTTKGYVTQSQATTMYSLVATQKDNLNSIVSVRTQIATLLRTLLNTSTSADAVKAQVLNLSATYGELDGVNNYYYATTFAQVYKSLSADQKTKLAALRKSMMSGKYADGTAFDFSVASTPFLYSSVLTDAQIAPYISDAATNPLFFEP